MMGWIQSVLVLEVVFWLSCALVALATLWYPIMLLSLSLFIKKKETPLENLENLPTVSLIIAAYNEEKVISAKLENSLSLIYPKEQLEIIVASDGATDRTDEIVRSFEDRRIKLYRYPRLGKTGIQNETVKKAKGDIVVFSDANAMYHRDAIRKLVRHFGDDRIGCVCGQLIYRSKDESGDGSGEVAYWNYEKFLKNFETRVSSLVGANGSIYAIRKSNYVEIDADLISDLVEPLEIVKSGKKVVYDREAISEEEASSLVEEEFRRKVRILTRSIEGVLHMKSLFNPFRYGIFAIQLLMHKMFRYLAPIFLLTGALSLVFLTDKTLYCVLFYFMIAGLIFAIIAKFSPGMVGRNRLLNLSNMFYYYVMVNFALCLAWINVIKGQKITIWVTERN